MLRWATLAGVAALVAAGGWIWSQGTAEGGRLPYDDADAVARGAALYEEYCASCHGADLEGEPDWRTRLPSGLMPAPPHNETGHTWHHPTEQLFLLTKHGVAEMVGGGYESAMPGFGDVLSDQQIREVLAFIKSTWPAEVIRRHDQMNEAAR
ncbi:c-type cytochrome [Tranquillimonas alkanivorans]|uniref:Cytochrome c, mono-and diheme variants n=1 Tax=Tranquillimonas alkanivorans TaxID=441119 RepID=A0A1I5KEH1_9RHOB|nr:cytochrome c [Tranquillimonas alkanivorans]SFO83016.1 Cytochrome c, mono-and diheme variants [Tranquillimonas alkanivorans]